MLLCLILAASRASGHFLVKPTAAKPVNVIVGVPTAVEFKLRGHFVCPTDEKPFAVIFKGYSVKDVLISHVDKTGIQSGPSDERELRGDGAKHVYFGLENGYQTFTGKLNYLATSPNTVNEETNVVVFGICGTFDAESQYVSYRSELFSKIPLGINAFEENTISGPVILSPEEVRREGDSNIVLRAPWPNACKPEKHPVVKLTLNANTGAKLLVFPSQDYKVYGLVDDKEQNITQVISSTVTQVNGFTALKFVKNTLVKDKYADLDFSFIEWNISHQKVEPATIDVQFICGGKYVKNYTGENAPTLKIQGSI